MPCLNGPILFQKLITEHRFLIELKKTVLLRSCRLSDTQHKHDPSWWWSSEILEVLVGRGFSTHSWIIWYWRWDFSCWTASYSCLCVCLPSGNFVTLSILLTTELGLSHSFCQMLVALLLSDSICIIMTFMLFSLPYITTVSPYVVPISLPIAQVALTMSVYMIIVLSLERFLVVSRPQKQVRTNQLLFFSA